jgi:hypothetical protein
VNFRAKFRLNLRAIVGVNLSVNVGVPLTASVPPAPHPVRRRHGGLYR